MRNAYASAAQRMHADAARSDNPLRPGTADHLFGLAAECALKAILLAHGVIPEPPKKPADLAIRKQFAAHINQLWGEYVAWARSLGALQLTSAPPFESWRVHDRYLHDDVFTADRVAQHRAGAVETTTLLERAIVDGVVA